MDSAPPNDKRIIVAITGASGGPIALRVIGELLRGGHELNIIMSESGRKVLAFETGIDIREGYAGNERVRFYDNSDLSADISSGTCHFEAMIIVPCSTSTLAKINCGIADNLITRVAAVAIKEKRRLIMVPRETPMSPIVLKNMKELADLGVVIIPPVMEFYTGPESIEDMVGFIVGKIMDSIGLKHNLYKGWTGSADTSKET